MNITFLTECGEKVGFGHFMRCLAIASAYKEKGINPKLIICVDKNIVQLQNYDYDNNPKFIDQYFPVVEELYYHI